MRANVFNSKISLILLLFIAVVVLSAGTASAEIVNITVSEDTSDSQSDLVTLTSDVEGSGEPIYSITSYYPLSNPTTEFDGSQLFNMTVNNDSSLVIYVDSVEVARSVTIGYPVYSLQRTLNAEDYSAGAHNVTITADRVFSDDFVSKTWTWTIEEEPVTPTPTGWQSDNSDVSFWNSGVGMLSIAMILITIGLGFKAFNDGMIDVNMLITISIALIVVTLVVAIGPGVLDKL